MNIITRAAGPAATGLKNIMSRFSPDSRQYKLGEMIVSALEEGGEDTQAVLSKLRAIRAGEVTEIETRARQLGIEPGKLTTAARVQSPVLAQMQAALRKNARVGPTMDRAAIENLEAVTEIVDLLVAMDDPEALALAADMQLAQYEAMLTARLNQVETKATETAGKAFTGTQQSAAKAGYIRHSVSVRTTSLSRAAGGEKRRIGDEVPPLLDRHLAAVLCTRYGKLFLLNFHFPKHFFKDWLRISPEIPNSLYF